MPITLQPFYQNDLPRRLRILDPHGGAVFVISSAPAMPLIPVAVALESNSPSMFDVGFALDLRPEKEARYTGTAEIAADCSDFNNGPSRTTQTTTVLKNTPNAHLSPYPDRFWISFNEIRGGTLTLHVSVTIDGQKYETTAQCGTVIATNPSLSQLQEAIPYVLLRKIASHESGMRQFDAEPGRTSPSPLWSRDQKGGVGIFQITNPSPSQEQIWDWRANVAKGIATYKEKLQIARNYPSQVRRSSKFQQLVQKYNDLRRQTEPNKPNIEVRIKEFTDSDLDSSPGQLQLDAIRGFNGFAGQDDFGNHLHEFRIALDQQGNLIVDIVPGQNHGFARWDRVPPADRPQNSGDPDYVNNVLSQAV